MNKMGSVVLENIGYFFENWNSDFISISVIIVLLLMISGFFYGKVIQRFIKPLKDLDCTFLGIFFIFAIFQMFTFFAVTRAINTSVVYAVFIITVLFSPVLCLLTKTVPSMSFIHLFSVISGIFIAVVLGIASSKLNTNNVYFDSVYYLSSVIENSVKPTLGSMDYYHGVINHFAFDKYHDLQGYCYIWSMIFKFVKSAFDIKTSLTPVYIWGGCILYWMSLGNLFANSINILWKKKKIIGVVTGLLILSPYYTNYFNTTLAFFGNSFRTILIGFALLVMYLYTKTKNHRLFIALFFLYYAGICVSSTSFFLCVFAHVALFFWMSFSNEKRLSHWMLYIISWLPLVRYALIILIQDYYIVYSYMIIGAIVIIGVLLVIAYLVRNHLDIVCKIGKVSLVVFAVFLAVLAFIVSKGQYGYSYFFTMRSLNDMTNNFTTHINNYELYRNIIFYILIVCLLVNFKKYSKYKIFLLIMGVLFLNPIVQPAISTFFTSDVYSRTFDLLVNPFVLLFLIRNFYMLFNNKIVTILGLTIISGISIYLGKINWLDYYSKTMYFQDEGYNWEYKVSNDAYDMYQYIQTHISNGTNDRPLILSQDASLKAYVNGVSVYFGSNDYREANESKELWEENFDMMTIMYPGKITYDTLINGEQGDFSKLEGMILESNADYVIMRNTIALWNEKGWFEESYKHIMDIHLCDKIYENDSWVILRVNPDYEGENVNG